MLLQALLETPQLRPALFPEAPRLLQLLLALCSHPLASLSLLQHALDLMQSLLVDAASSRSADFEQSRSKGAASPRASVRDAVLVSEAFEELALPNLQAYLNHSPSRRKQPSDRKGAAGNGQTAAQQQNVSPVLVALVAKLLPGLSASAQQSTLGALTSSLRWLQPLEPLGMCELPRLDAIA